MDRLRARLLGRREDLPRSCGVLLTDQQLEAETAPSQMVAHAASPVGLDHGVNACRFQHGSRKVRFDFGCEPLNDNKSDLLHAEIIRLQTAIRFVRRGQGKFSPHAATGQRTYSSR